MRIARCSPFWETRGPADFRASPPRCWQDRDNGDIDGNHPLSTKAPIQTCNSREAEFTPTAKSLSLRVPCFLSTSWVAPCQRGVNIPPRFVPWSRDPLSRRYGTFRSFMSPLSLWAKLENGIGEPATPPGGSCSMSTLRGKYEWAWLKGEPQGKTPLLGSHNFLAGA